MEHLKNEIIEKKIILEKQEEEEKKTEPRPTTFQVRKFKTRFSKIAAYKLPEDSTIHCANGEKLIGKAGNYYVCLDAITELIIEEKIFKKLFIFDWEKDDIK